MKVMTGHFINHSSLRGMWPTSETNIDKGIVEIDGVPDFTDEIRACEEENSISE
jgi:hypothetical protein